MSVPRITDPKVAETVAYYMQRIAMSIRRNPLVNKETLTACSNLCAAFYRDIFDFAPSKFYGVKDSLQTLHYYFLDMRFLKSGDIEAQERADFDSAKLFVDALKDEATGYHMELDACIFALHKAINET